MEVVPDRSARSLCGFVEAAVEPGAVVVTDAWGGYATLSDRGYRHLPVAAQGDPSVAEDFLPISHLIFSNLKSWLRGCHHGVSPRTFKPISTSSRSGSIAVFTRSMRSGHCLGSAGRRWPRRMTGCTPVHGNIQNATVKAWRASSELRYRQNRHQIWYSWVSTGQELSTTGNSVGAAFLLLKEQIITTYEGDRSKKGPDPQRTQQLAALEQYIGKPRRHWF